jgi:hypothetical protein
LLDYAGNTGRIQEKSEQVQTGETVKNYREQSHLPGTPVSEASESLDAVVVLFSGTRRSTLLAVLALAVMMLGMLAPSYGQGTNVFNCSSGFSKTGSCGIYGGSNGSSAPSGFWTNIYGTLSGADMLLLPANSVHQAAALNYWTTVNEQAFSAAFTFVPNGQNIAFIEQNTNNVPGYQNQRFQGGAGCEAGFYQGYDPPTPNNMFALEFDSYSSLIENGPFTYSSVQIYQQGQPPCTATGVPDFYETNKISTSPVPLNSPANGQDKTTGDTYQANLVYTGTTLTLQLYDVTTGGSCPGSSCFTNTWTNLNIPSMVGGTTAYPGIVAASGSVGSSYPLNVNSFVYNILSPASAPTFSPAAGTYPGAQSVTLSGSTSGSYICYNFTGAPATNGIGGCANGTLYSGAISVPSGATIYAVAGVPGTYGDSSVASAAYNITGTASTPTFNQPGGVWSGNQTVQLTAAQGGVICYNTTGSPATNGSTGCSAGTLYSAPINVSSNQTIYAVAGGTGFTDSAVGSAAYTINPFAGTPAANSPAYSPAPGNYAATQSVTLSSSTPGSYICYTLASSAPSLMPQPNNAGGCTVGTLYNGPVSVSSTQTLYSMAGTNYASLPSSLVQGAYIIGAGSGTPGAPTNGKAVAVPSN